MKTKGNPTCTAGYGLECVVGLPVRFLQKHALRWRNMDAVALRHRLTHSPTLIYSHFLIVIIHFLQEKKLIWTTPRARDDAPTKGPLFP